MSEPINPRVIDLSHWDPAQDYAKVKKDDIVGVIYKSTQGTGYTDDTYIEQRSMAKAQGLLWGSYHFAEATDVLKQVDNYLSFTEPDPDELICLDWEDYGSNTMSVEQCIQWTTEVEKALGRPGQVVIYSGNTAKEMLDGANDFFGSRRLWLAQYGTSPECQSSWETYWIWQFTDGIYGPSPHSVDGVGPCDINSFNGTTEDLIAQWATGVPDLKPPRPVPPQPPQLKPKLVHIDLTVPPGVRITATVNGIPVGRSRRSD